MKTKARIVVKLLIVIQHNLENTRVKLYDDLFRRTTFDNTINMIEVMSRKQCEGLLPCNG